MRKIDLKAEKEFENNKVLDSSIRAKQSKFYKTVNTYNKKYNAQTISLIKNKTVLEIGCSTGVMALQYSPSCNTYYGCDISDKAIEEAKKLNIKNANFLCCDAHKLPYKDNTFNVVIVNSLLHHLELNVAIKEICRVLKKNGQLVLKEPLGINPLFNFYRKLTPEARTIDEKPFDLKDFKLLLRYFNVDHLQYYGFTSLISAYVNNEVLRTILTNFDYALSKTPLKYLFWTFSGVLTKKG